MRVVWAIVGIILLFITNVNSHSLTTLSHTNGNGNGNGPMNDDHHRDGDAHGNDGTR
jgi:hypothetical protein